MDSRLSWEFLESSYKIPPMLGPLFERRQLSMRAPCGSRRNPPMSIIPRWFVRRAVSLLALPIFAAKDVSGLIRQGCQIFAAEVAGDGTVPIDEIHQVPRKLVSCCR